MQKVYNTHNTKLGNLKKIMLINKNNNLVYLSNKLTFNGTIESKHNIYLAGEINGKIHSDKNIYVLKDAKVYSDIIADNIQIFGLVEGNIQAKKKIIINDEAHVFGNIKCQSLKLSEGAIYSGELEVVKNQSAA